MDLYLNNNGSHLSSLPAGLFDDLAALRYLHLQANSLRALPAELFDDLTALENLNLNGNLLRVVDLPDGIFERLTALTSLDLGSQQRQGQQPIAPTAIAGPDNGRVSSVGGEVELDGSDSGGAWGTNVTYEWELTTAPNGVTVAFDDAAADSPRVTIPALPADSVLIFTLTVSPKPSGAIGVELGKDTATVTVTVDRRLTLTVSPSSVSEDAVATVVEVTGTLDGTPLTSAAQVAVTVGASDDTATEGTDYATVADFTLTIAAGEASGTTMFTLTPTDDAVDEVDEETLSVTGTTEASGVGDVVGTTVTITDDDESSFTVTAVPTSIAEDGGATTVTVSTGGVTFADDREIALTLTGTATKGTDYTVDSETLTLTAGETSVATMVTAVQDVVDDDAETIVITAEGAQATVTITEDDESTGGICGRTAKVQTAILRRISGVTDCAAVTDAHLAAITGELDLSFKSITALAAGDFAGLTALETLNLRYSGLTTLTAGVFDGLTALETLNLYGNGLTTLTAGVFDGLTALETLNLYGNDLTTLTDGVFDGLTALENLSLGSNGLTTLTDGVFDGLTALETLRLDGRLFGNGLTTLTAGVFDGLTALKELLLHNNDLTTLPDEVFAGLTALETLSLGSNGLTTLTAGVFDGLTALETLKLYSNRLTTLPVGVFGGLTALTWLRLEENDLTTLPVGVFGGLTALDQLYLYGNDLTTLTAGVFDGLTALEELLLFDNDLTTLPDGVFDELTALEDLSLISNGLTTLPAGVFAGLTALEELLLFDNDLTTLPAGVFDGLTALEDLGLHENALTTLPAGVFDELTALKQLDLSYNSLSSLPAGVFEKLTAMYYLGLNDNPGARFSPKADALPDDGTVLPAGGTVMLDGSGSNGRPWGTNVTYSWSQTPGLTSGVTFDPASATPVVTIPALPAGTELTFTLTVTGRATPPPIHNWGTRPGTDTATVTVVFDPTAGICGRTEQVRDKLLGLIEVNEGSAVTCADVTDAHLAAISALFLNGAGITALAAGDFDGLTALTALDLNDNSLSSLPAGVFENLTALTDLQLNGNRGASFSPTADALPDNGTVPASGGKVTLDGSSSDGGPWGTNVTYSWSETSGPTSGVTFDDDTSATPVVTIPALTAGTELTFTLTVAGRATDTSFGTAPDTDTATVTVLSTDATLSALTVNDGTTDHTIDLTTTPYEVDVGNTVTTVTLTATPTHTGASVSAVTLAGGTIDDDVFTDGITVPSLVEGDNAIVVTVTAEDGTTMQTYTVTVTVNAQETGGICGRTAAVQTAILGKISGVTDCALVTDADLAAITGELYLNNQSITALAAGDFDGLTALETLYLYYNALTTLPAGVFDELTALTILDLDFNGLTTLPDEVFDELTALNQLFLEDNGLDTLPAGVFDGLTALTKLTLLGNPGAPFSPEAVARSDDETVPDTGGMVRLDGSGSNGGPWGTNVTYGWALTAPASGVSVTFDDDTSVTPQVTVPALPADTEQLTFTLTVTGRGGTSGIAPATATVTVTVTEDLRPYVTLASPNAYHLETLGLHANEATGRPVTLVVLFSAEVTGLEAEEFVIENGEVTDVYWVDCLSNPSRVRWCIVMQPADAQDERMTLTIPENIADGGNQPAPEVYYAVLRGTAPTGTFTTAAVEPVSRDFLARLTFDQDMLEDAPGTETLVFPEKEYLKSPDFVVPDEAVARITLDGFTHADDGSTIEVRIYPPGLLYQEPMSVVLPAGAALSETGYPNPELKLEVLVDTFTGSTLQDLALTDLEFSPALDFATIRDHAASVGNEVVATEVTATPTVADAIVEIEPPDADPDTVGHQVALDVGDTTVTVTVKDANSPDLVTDGSVNKSWQQTYNVVITRAPAKVSLARTDDVQNVEEGSDAPFTLTRIGDRTQPLVVFVEVAGAEWLSPGTWPTEVTIPAGATVHDFTVQTSDDHVERDNGAITVRVLAGSEYELTDADAGEASIRIHDNDTQSLLLSHSSLDVSEGSSASYTVKLVSQPSADVTVDITGHSGTDLTLAPASASLTFTADDWDTAQTVTVEAGQDDDAVDDTATLVHTAAGGGYDAVTRNLGVTVTDNDEASLTLSKASLGVTEGSSDTYTVKLATQPSADVTVDITGHSGTDLTLAPASASLTFTADDWDTAQTVTVQAGEDDDATNDTATLLHTATGGGYDAVTKELAVTVTDNDEPGLALSKASLGVTEGSSDTYTVKLATQPSAEVTVDITGHSDTDLTLAPASASLTFTADDWDTAQTVTVQAGEDADATNDTATLLHTATGGDYDAVTKELAVTVTENDEAGLTLSKASLGVTEGSSDTYTVKLATQPSADVTVDITGHSGTDLTLAPASASLTFTADDWDTAQTVTVQAGEDDDATNDTATLLHTATGGDYDAVTKELAVTVTENDETGLTLSKASLGVTEGSSDTYTVKLATQPSAQVTVDITGHSGTDLTLAPASASLTFTADDWDTAQTVTVQAGEDDDATNDTATLLHTATGGDYDAVTKELAVTVTENDETGLTLSKASLGVTEGSSDTYTVKLATQPTAQVRVDITGHSDTDLTLAPASAILTFTADDWDTAQTVTVQAGEDDDATNDTATLLHTAAGGDYDAVTKELAVTVTENDETGLTLSKASLGVTEGSSDTYTVKLATQPTAQVTVDITGHSGTDLTLAPASASLTFTADDWDTAQTVTVQAGEDDDATNDTATLAATGGDAAASRDGPDGRRRRWATEGTSDTYTVKLGEVRVDITGHSGTDLTLAPARKSDVHGGRLGHGADGDGAGRRGRRRDERHGDAAAHGDRRRRRSSGNR